MATGISCIARDNPFDPANRHALPAGEKTIVTSQDSLMARALSARAGDTIALAAGTYVVSLRFGSSGTADLPIVLAGTDSTTVVRAQPGLGILYISGQRSIRFSNIVFDSSYASGVKVENGSSDIDFSDCAFRDNALDGLEITDSDVRAARCAFLNNGRNGVRISGDATAGHTAALDNVLSAHNAKEGIAVIATPATVTQATVSDNDSCGISITTPAGAVSVTRSIIAYNAGAAVSGLWDSTVSQVVFDSLDLFLNQQEITLAPASAQQYWTYDPMFANRNACDYSIGPGSEVYLMEQQGIVIGYRK